MALLSPPKFEKKKSQDMWCTLVKCQHLGSQPAWVTQEDLISKAKTRKPQ